VSCVRFPWRRNKTSVYAPTSAPLLLFHHVKSVFLWSA
jgi:hypothetical protein